MSNLEELAPMHNTPVKQAKPSNGLPASALISSPLDTLRPYLKERGGSVKVPNNEVILSPIPSPSHVIELQSPSLASDYNSDTAESLAEVPAGLSTDSSRLQNAPLAAMGEGIFATSQSGVYGEQYFIPKYQPVNISGMPNTVIPVLLPSESKLNGNAGTEYSVETSTV